MSSLRRFAVVGAVLVAIAAVLILRETRGLTTAGEPAGTQSAPLPRLVDLGAKTCIPCKMMEPILAQLKERYTGSLVVEVIDVRQDRHAATRYGIRVIPTQIFIDASGTERFRHEGFMSMESILAKWKELGVDLASDVGSEP